MNATCEVHNNNQGTLRTKTGVSVNILKPTTEMINLTDIATGLGQICRFGGQTNRMYTVAEHSILVAALAPTHLKREALLHDASEAYLGDMIKPLKNLIGPAYTDIENNFMQVISEKFDLSADKLKLIKQYDKQAVELEYKAFMRNDSTSQAYMDHINMLLQIELNKGYSRGLSYTYTFYTHLVKFIL